jgi:hypothetical protein
MSPLEFNCAENTHRVDISKFPPGIYSVVIYINGDLKATEKLIIVR